MTLPKAGDRIDAWTPGVQLRDKPDIIDELVERVDNMIWIRVGGYLRGIPTRSAWRLTDRRCAPTPSSDAPDPAP